MKFLRIEKLCFYSFGYSFQPNETKLLRFYAFLNWALLIGVTLPEAHFAIENKTNIELVTDTLATLLTCILTLTKVMRMFYKKNQLYNIVWELDNMWSEVASEDKKILEKATEAANRLTLVYFICAIGTGFSYLIGPIAKAVYELETTGNTTWIMPMRAVFIYDTTVSPNYELTFLWFAHGTFMAVCGSVGIDCMFYGCAFSIGSHFQVIQKRLRKMNFEKFDISTGNRKLSDELQQSIRYHQKMLMLSKGFSELYKPILFVQFLITSIQICVIAYQLTLPDQFAVAVATKTFFLATICFQCFTYCDAGSQLIAETFGVSDAIYTSCWYKSSIVTKKCIGFILMRAQKPFVVHSGFYVANLKSFNSILSAAASYITILQSLQNDR